MPFGPKRAFKPTAFRGFKRPTSGRLASVAEARSAASRYRDGRYPTPGPARQELKVIDTAENTYAIDTTGSVTPINLVATGTDYTDRIGRKIVIKSVLVQGVTNPQDTDVGGNLGRVMLLYDTQPNGATPTIGNIFTAATSTSPLNLSNRDRFKVIWDKRWGLGFHCKVASTSYSTDSAVSLLHKYKKCNLDTVFNGTAGTIATVQSGSLLLVTIGSVVSAAGHNLIASVRVRFVDA